MQKLSGVSENTPIQLADNSIHLIKDLDPSKPILIPAWNERAQCFVNTKGQVKQLQEFPIWTVRLTIHTLEKTTTFPLYCTPDTKLLVSRPLNPDVHKDTVFEQKNNLFFLPVTELEPKDILATSTGCAMVDYVDTMVYPNRPIYTIETMEQNFCSLFGITIRNKQETAR